MKSPISNLKSASLPPLLLQRFERIAEAPHAIPRLRQFILDLAFRGKLLLQSPDEGSGHELLQSISKAHHSDRKFGGNRSGQLIENPMDCSAEIGIPESWAWAYLDFICDTISDVDHKMPKAVASGVPFVSARDLRDDGTIDTKNAKRISEEDYQRLSRKVQIRQGDIIYSRIGTIGKARLVTTDVRFIISYSCCLIRPLRNFVALRYVQAFLESNAALDQAHKGTQGIGVPDLGLGEIKRFKMPLPPLAEQHRIVAKVDELMALCDRLEAAQADRESRRTRLVASTHASLAPSTLDPRHSAFFIRQLAHVTSRPADIPHLRQTILNLAVRGKLVPQDPSDKPAESLSTQIVPSLGEIAERAGARFSPPSKMITPAEGLPTGWGIAPLVGIGITQTGTTPSKSEPTFAGNHIPFIKPGDIDGDTVDYTNEGLSVDGLAAGRLIPRNSILMVSIGGSIGKTAIVDREVSCNQQINAVTPAGCLEPRFVLCAIRSQDFQTEVARRASQGTLPIISKSKWETISIPVPPLAEQARIVAKVDELMTLCDRLESQLTTTQTESRRLLDAVLAQLTAS